MAPEPSDNLKRSRRLPAWLKRPLPTGGLAATTRRVVQSSGVATVCQEARCPNLGECWSHRTATFMILGDRCTRRCHFCAVETARPAPPEPDEPQRLADAAAELGLKHVVITSVARDDLPDEGAGHFAACIRAVRDRLPSAVIEVLPADFHARPECIATVCAAEPDIFNHNLETVERLTPVIRPQAKYRRSLETLRLAGQNRPGLPIKSGLMVGLGETTEEIEQALADLRSVSCSLLTIGQYLQPSPRQSPVARFYTPEEFKQLKGLAEQMGFSAVASGPFVRSSYQADRLFTEGVTPPRTVLGHAVVNAERR
ncbi:MAG: lipoyl synthase [Phycisphaerales bacterium]|nr:lipoyl synthase [Phycisphaerales bacterium]